MHAGFSKKRCADRRAHTLRNNRFNARELFVGGSVLGQERHSIFHHFTGDRAADSHLARIRFQLFIAGARGNRKKFSVVGILFSYHSFRQQRDHSIGRCRAKDDVRCFLKNLVQIEPRAERFAHLVKFAEDICFSLQRFENFVARDAR